ncbi:MAG: stkP 2 [Bacillales bacterium]|jgi:serine/threonine-protein kinase|nr:stkP 2 [Bacillales bacterium]
MIQIGDWVDRKYLVKQKIGQGGMSTVFLVQDNRLQKDWALKTIEKSAMKNGEVYTQSLLSEVELLKKIDHPAIPRIIDIFEDENQISIVLDFVKGQSLDRILEVSGPLSQNLSIQIGLQVCDALIYLHGLHVPVIYRDIKPANLVIEHGCKVRLIDFGIARELKNGTVEDTNCLGTRGYAAPEQYGGSGQSDKRTDIYCLGVTMYHLLTGHNPTNPPYEISSIRKKNPQLSRGLEKIIKKATKSNPEERYQNCSEFKKALENYKKEDGVRQRKQQKLIVKFIATFIIFLISTVYVCSSNYQGVSTIKSDCLKIKKEFQTLNLKELFGGAATKFDRLLKSNGIYREV